MVNSDSRPLTASRNVRGNDTDFLLDPSKYDQNNSRLSRFGITLYAFCHLFVFSNVFFTCSLRRTGLWRSSWICTRRSRRALSGRRRRECVFGVRGSWRERPVEPGERDDRHGEPVERAVRSRARARASNSRRERHRLVAAPVALEQRPRVGGRVRCARVARTASAALHFLSRPGEHCRALRLGLRERVSRTPLF